MGSEDRWFGVIVQIPIIFGTIGFRVQEIENKEASQDRRIEQTYELVLD